jgi:hypothetical protein
VTVAHINDKGEIVRDEDEPAPRRHRSRRSRRPSRSLTLPDGRQVDPSLWKVVPPPWLRFQEKEDPPEREFGWGDVGNLLLVFLFSFGVPLLLWAITLLMMVRFR